MALILPDEPGQILLTADVSESAKTPRKLRGTLLSAHIAERYWGDSIIVDGVAVFEQELPSALHFYFRDIHYTDNAEMAMLTVLTLMSKSGKKLSELVAPYRKYHATGEINFEVEDKDARMQAVEDAFGEGANVFRLDGLSVEHTDWWCNVRPSNTEPVLRLNLEARTPELRDEMRTKVENIIRGETQ